MGGKINRGRQRKRWRDELQQYWGQSELVYESKKMLRLSSRSGLIMAEDDIYKKSGK